MNKYYRGTGFSKFDLIEVKKDVRSDIGSGLEAQEVIDENIGDYDIVLASRCLNGIANIKDTLVTLNEIANKYVYITLFGLSSQEYKKEKAKIAGKPFKAGTDYSVLFLILKSLNIESNILQLDCKNLKEYHDIDEAIERSVWRLGELDEENKIALENHFKETFIKNEKGNWVNPKDKTDLVLIWWKKEEIK